MKLFVGHITRDNAYIMPCMFLVCAEDINKLFDALCEQYVTYFKGIPNDMDIMELAVEFNIEMLPTVVSLMDETIKFDFCEILTALASDGKEIDNECIVAESV